MKEDNLSEPCGGCKYGTPYGHNCGKEIKPARTQFGICLHEVSRSVPYCLKCQAPKKVCIGIRNGININRHGSTFYFDERCPVCGLPDKLSASPEPPQEIDEDMTTEKMNAIKINEVIRWIRDHAKFHEEREGGDGLH